METGPRLHCFLTDSSVMTSQPSALVGTGTPMPGDGFRPRGLLDENRDQEKVCVGNVSSAR